MTQRAGAVAALMRCTPQGASRSLCAVEHAEQAGPPLDPLHNRPHRAYEVQSGAAVVSVLLAGPSKTGHHAARANAQKNALLPFAGRARNAKGRRGRQAHHRCSVESRKRKCERRCALPTPAPISYRTFWQPPAKANMERCKEPLIDQSPGGVFSKQRLQKTE
jgi:hypothetical protein